ncbi:TetR/AcrR family transcriptional regulator [Kordiimonas sp. SCSIO 12610]|uniref:TetR/AcrR family transcriptional regulator n=1 Tax=Kordiimonas sp. SCSIO 12610 TaxID=2829597 RepID=UPI00210B3F44|nr:WHG domain-containing protein [Kordiimonas sp. SCSIO 12610]UTW54802.1 TetR/AcrR family transcriptional regulator [Kordiimonas sp. SCSIO 12610]
MGRRSDHSRKDLLNLALNAAEKIVEKQGTKGLTARKVASEIGYSVGTIYNLFDNLDDLNLHIKARTLDAMYEFVKDVPLGNHVESDFQALNKAYFEFLRQNPKTLGTILDRLDSNGKPLPDWYLEKVAKPFSVVENALAPLFHSKDREKLEYAARTLWCGVHGIATLELDNPADFIGQTTAEEMALYLIETFLKGLKS